MNLKELRLSKKITQEKASELCKVSLRTYKTYENDPSRTDTIKYNYMMSVISEYGKIDESHGILTIDSIKSNCTDIFKEYDIPFCYLFGSYAKNSADERSDVDLLIGGNISGLKFYGLTEKIRQSLNKKIDALDLNQLVNNKNLIHEILSTGIKIYG